MNSDLDDNKVQEILATVRYATISTVDENGNPWAAPVWYVADKDNNIYWWSPKESQHSKNLSTNPNVYITIFDSQSPEGEGLGLYIRANASELLEKSKVLQAIELFNASFEKYNLNYDKCSGKAPTRIFKAIPEIYWINDDSEIDGYFVDTRKELR